METCLSRLKYWDDGYSYITERFRVLDELSNGVPLVFSICSPKEPRGRISGDYGVTGEFHHSADRRKGEEGKEQESFKREREREEKEGDDKKFDIRLVPPQTEPHDVRQQCPHSPSPPIKKPAAEGGFCLYLNLNPTSRKVLDS
ncbi:unnamed protein product [Larinioides sclopetarius]|uniref:Uncharacterized protein n=1 Tax=Larinioides sclopetarius TaxID=280406 RepID=A0AAV1ZIY3_9ARAC